MKYLFIMFILVLLFNTDYQANSLEKADSLAHNIILSNPIETLNNKIQKQEVKIAELQAARDDYFINIKFYSLLITVIFAGIALLAGYFTVFNFKSYTKGIEEELQKFKDEYEKFKDEYKKFKDEYKKDKEELDDIKNDALLTSINTLVSDYNKYLENKEYPDTLLNGTIIFINSIKFINLIKNKNDKQYFNYWFVDIRNTLNKIIDDYNDYKNGPYSQLNERYKKVILQNINIIINLKSDLFQDETQKFKKIKEEIEAMKVKNED